MHPLTRRIIDRTPARLRPAARLVVGTIDETVDDRVPGLAAEIAFFALLSLPPLLLTLLGGVGLVGDLVGRTWRAELASEMEAGARLVLSSDGQAVLRDLLDTLVLESRASVFGLSLVFTLYSASRAFTVLSTAVTIAYDLEATRPAWKHRLWGLGATVTGLLASAVLGPLVIAGPEGGQTLSNLAGGIPALSEVWRVAYWPTAGVTLILLVAALYHVAAPWHTPFRRDLPGAVLAVALWLVGTAALRVYVGQTIGETYGFIATPLVILLWLYVSAFALLLGAEVNAAIEREWPTQGGSSPATSGGPNSPPASTDVAWGDGRDVDPVGPQPAGRAIRVGRVSGRDAQ